MLVRCFVAVLLGPAVVCAEDVEEAIMADAPVCNCDADTVPLQSEITRLQKQLVDLTAEATSQQQQLFQEAASVKQQLADVTAEAASQRQQLGRQQNDLTEAKAETARVKQQLADVTATTPFSFVGTAQSALKAGTEGADFVLKSSAGEQLSEVVAPHVEKAKAAAAEIVKQAANVNYLEYAEALKTSDPYVSHVAPHLETAWSTTQPHWQAYGKPLVEQGTVAYENFQRDVLPSLKTGTLQVGEALKSLPGRFSKVFVHVDDALARLFDTVTVSCPKAFVAHFPTTTTDRIIFLFLCTFFGYHIFLASLKLLRIILFVSRNFMKVMWVLFRFGVLLPIKIIRIVFGFIICVCTCGCCCGLCRRKRPKALAGKAEKPSNGTNGTNGTTAGNGKETLGKVTAEELVKLLEVAKKQGKLDTAAKQIVSLVKSGKEMTSPKTVAGKTVTKEVAAKAFSSFKELDVKKLNL
jgi:hypothetical protein